MRTSLHGVAGALTGLAGLVAVAALGVAAPAAATTTPGAYVALGDSYSAGSGVWPPDPQAPPECARSSSNYPHVIATVTGASLTDVTCGAAQTKDFSASQYPDVAPQLDALGPGTQLVTLTIGGNDNNVFIGSIAACGSAGAATLGQGSPCKDLYGSYFDDQIDAKTAPAVTQALADVHARAPHARVAILGYPWILPPTMGCFTKMSIAEGDVPYLREIQGHLNSVIARAATQTGSTYVDFSQVSEGHDACQPIGTRWIEPVLFGTNTVPVHPNALGESAMADQTMSVLHLR
jgi:lysophospholipase L1-like esterase